MWNWPALSSPGNKERHPSLGSEARLMFARDTTRGQGRHHPATNRAHLSERLPMQIRAVVFSPSGCQLTWLVFPFLSILINSFFFFQIFYLMIIVFNYRHIDQQLARDTILVFFYWRYILIYINIQFLYIWKFFINPFRYMRIMYHKNIE